MYTEWDIYCIYRKVQANKNNRGYRLPKDWDDYYTNKLAPDSQRILTMLKDYFNTKWCDISIERYFEAGFNVYKNLSYKQMLDKRIIKEYIRLDKVEKINDNLSKKSIISSVKFVFSEYNSFEEYCNITYNNYMRQPIKDYIDNKISIGFMVYLIKFGFIKLNEEEKSLLPNIMENYRRISIELDNIYKFNEDLLKINKTRRL